MIALVTGASGCVGYALCEALLADGGFHEVRGLVRRADAELPPGVVRVVSDLSCCADADVIFHCAALVHQPDAAKEDYHKVNVGFTGQLLDACNPERPPRFLFFSTVAVYGESTPRTGVAEDAPPAPATPYAASKLAAEKLIDRWADDVGAVAVHLRLATVYGPRDRGNIAKLETAIRTGRFFIPGDGQNKKTLCAVEYAATAAIALARMGSMAVAGKRFVIADAAPYTLREIVVALGGKPFALPLPLALLAARVLKGRTGVAQVRKLAADNVYRGSLPASLPPAPSLRSVSRFAGTKGGGDRGGGFPLSTPPPRSSAPPLLPTKEEKEGEGVAE
ncbi:NAD-dependent epimerase/dehydratase family protein [Armatimonas rosea]|uniref:UDP-glucose 4-epimerase n=1 Tax=Armatimonas rosea TaxID=685828 RepID=A0A7W9SUZ6_ARMRO|nr:NAD-dependent epimerase/dehydratase family protein [Armatimonas rosea]MBB6053352.1 UDP-glucose 4-epimerase [Armatimonas rosea]